MVPAWLKKNWFVFGLILLTGMTLADPRQLVVQPGLWIKQHGGPDAVIVLIFLLSGLALNTSQIRDGIGDLKGTVAALILIFIIAPLMALPFLLFSLPLGLLFGLLLVAVMPTTLSSGVVMTGGAGGNIAHALLITICANCLAVFTIPVSLGIILPLAGAERVVAIERLPIMIKIATLVLLPLGCGIILRRRYGRWLVRVLPYTTVCCQIAILAIVWMALCAGRPAIIEAFGGLLLVVVVVALFHLLLLGCGLALTRLLKIPKGRRESVILMGGQKTLPLSVILQVSLFPEYGLALSVCVAHHIIHLIMDAFVIRYLITRE